MHKTKTRIRVRGMIGALAVAVLFPAVPAQAAGVDPLIEGAKLCTQHMPRYEREYGIPTHLLSAIASTESGRYHTGLKLRIPWPWTINAKGQGYYYSTKREAVLAAKKFLAQGVQSFDVGCMQVNVYHHPTAFGSMDDAFEPQKNIAYAASFLRNLYEEGKSWKQASAAYHSRTPSLGSKYVGRVYDSWYQIVDKLRLAKMHVPATTLAALKDQSLPETSSRAPAQKTTRLPSQKNKQVAEHRAPRMKVIQLSDKNNDVRENGVIIVRPEIKVVDASISMATTSSRAPVVSDAKIIPVSQQHVSSRASQDGPRFIFSD